MFVFPMIGSNRDPLQVNGSRKRDLLSILAMQAYFVELIKELLGQDPFDM